MDALGLIFLASQKKKVMFGWDFGEGFGFRASRGSDLDPHVPTVISLPSFPWGCLWMGLAAWVPRVINP